MDMNNLLPQQDYNGHIIATLRSTQKRFFFSLEHFTTFGKEEGGEERRKSKPVSYIQLQVASLTHDWWTLTGGPCQVL